jgi:translocation and assembly module TamA
MNIFFRSLIFLCAALMLATISYAGIPYIVEYQGIEDPSALKTIRSIAQLNTLKKHPPDSINAIRYRAESDIPEILKVLHSYGYYEAVVQVQIQETYQRVLVLVKVDTGPAYSLKEFHVSLYDSTPDHPISCPKIQIENLGIHLDKPIRAANVINAELKILEILAQCGYPLAKIAERKVVADGDTKTVDVQIKVDTGPLARFGSVILEGNTSVKPLYFEQKLEWKKGQTYNSTEVEETQKALMDSGLFSSVLITHGDTVSENGELPINIEVAESKHKSINMGVSYQTYYGPGLTFGWENRNIGGMGRRLTLQGDVTRRSHSGIATYLIPNFCKVGQDYVWQAQAMHQNIIPFSERTYNLANRLEKRFNKRLRISGGVKGERLFVTSSVQNGNYWLLEFPIYLVLDGSNSLLNPTQGYNFEYSASPSLTLSPTTEFYFVNEFSLSHYLPLTKSRFLVLAQKLSWGFIFSKDERLIPVSKRFFGGSEEELRGYAYYSVSPLNEDNKPIGGRSEVYYSLETRFRITKTIGLVPFFDMGNVYKNQIPTFKGKWLKSVGIGFRYFSFVGPFRLDIGFPLDRRKELDKKYRILVSVGQSF